MSKSFIINNQYGSMIFDDSLYGVYVKSGQGISTNTGPLKVITPSLSLSVEGLVAVKPDPSAYVRYSHSDDVNSYYWSIGHSLPYTRDFPYIQLAQPQGVVPESSDYGLQIFNASGVKTFDSNMSCFVIRDIVTVTLAEALTAASIGKPSLTDVYKTHAYCADPYYIINNYNHVYADYFYTSSGWTIYYNTTGVSSVNNTSLKIGNAGGVTYRFVSDADKSAIQSVIAANNASFPQYILVGEIINP